MAEKVGTIKILLWIGIILCFTWFLYYTFHISTLRVTQGLIFLARQFAILGLGWAVLLFFAQKDVKKNLAIINGAIITGALFIIASLVYKFLMDIWFGWIDWLTFALLFVFTVLLFIFKPKATQ